MKIVLDGMLLYCISWVVLDNCCRWLVITLFTFDARAYIIVSSFPSISMTVDPTSHSCIISATLFLTWCSDGRMERWCELRKERMRRMVLYGINVNFSSCIMSSTDSLCSTGMPAAVAADVTMSGLRLMRGVNCFCSSCACCCGVDVAGDDSDCNTISCVRDRRCLVLLVQLDDPTCGVERGSSLTFAWLADWSVRVPSGFVWCVFSLFNTWCCSSVVNASLVSMGRFWGRMFSYNKHMYIHISHTCVHTYRYTYIPIHVYTCTLVA